MSQRSTYRPDPYPYTFLVEETLRSGRVRVQGFCATERTNWSLKQVNQRATRFQTGDRTIHDLSMLNYQVWDRLSDGGVGAKATSDATRYRWAENVFAGDDGEWKLAPLPMPMVFEIAGWTMARMLVWYGPKVTGRAAGAGDEAILFIGHNGVTTSIFQVNAGGTGVSELVPGFAGQVQDACIFKNRLYLALGGGVGIKMVQWNGSAYVVASLNTDPKAERIHADGEWLYWSLGNDVFRSADPTAATLVKQGPVVVGEGAPVSRIRTFGQDAAIGIFVRTWLGLYRILEEDGVIKRAFVVDRRDNSADSDNDVLEVVNNELVMNYPRGLLRHTLGQTAATSPNDDDGVPDSARGSIRQLVDGVGGVYAASNPIGTGRPVIYRWQEGIWHPFLTWSQTARIDSLFFSTRQSTPTARLWIGWQDSSGIGRVSYVPLPTSSTNYRGLAGLQQPISGRIELPIFRGEFGELTKLWAGLNVRFLDTGVEAGGNVVVERCADPDATTPVWKEAGTYTCVPRGPSGGRDWVACQPGVIGSEQMRLDEHSEGLSLALKLTRGDGSAYPDSGLQHELGVTVLPLNNLLVQYGIHSPNSGVNAALLRWTGARWDRVPLEAEQIKDVLEVAADVVLVAGRLWIGEQSYGLAVWNPQTDVITPVAAFNGKRMWRLVKRGTTFLALGDGEVWASPSASDLLLTWSRVHTYQGEPTVVLRLQTGDVLLGGMTHWNGNLLDSAVVLITGTSGSTATIAMTNVNAQLLRGAVQRADGEVWIATTTQVWRTNGGGIGGAWVNESTGLTATEITAMGLSTVGGVFVGVRQGHVYVRSGGGWNQVVVGPNGHPWGVKAIVPFYTGCLIVARYTSIVQGPTVEGTRMRYHVAQAMWLPPVATAVSPVVVRAGLSYLEFPPYLRTYTLQTELADESTLGDGTYEPRSAEQQKRDLEELCRREAMVTLITPDRQVIRGFLGGFSCDGMPEERDVNGNPLDPTFAVSFTITEAEPQADVPIVPRKPGVY